MGFQLGGASHAAITQMRGREPGKHHRRPKLGGMRIRCVNCPEKFESMSEMVAHTRSGQCTESLKVEVVEHPSSLGLPPFAFNFDRDGRHMPVQDVDASRLEVDGLHHSPGGLGSKGVFFLKLAGEENSVVVIKQGSLESAGDFFASLLYDALYVPTPSVRVLGLDEFKRLAAAVGNRPCSVPGAADKLQFDLPCGEYSRGKGCLLMEYLRGQTLKHPDVHASLKDPAISAAVLRGLGAVIGVDILINNYDRAPYVWDHMGNANNLLIHVDGKNTRVSAIDQHCTAITNPEGLSKYLATVQKATREAVESDASGEYVGRVRGYFKQFAGGHDIGLDGCAHVHAGLLETLRRIVDFDRLAELCGKVAETFDQAGWGAFGAKANDADFMEKVRSAIAAALV